jgi:hypothetical protein
MLTRYDPERAPDPKRWLAMDEGERIELARRFHRKARIRVPNEYAHAAFHQVVETQVAMGDETPAAATLQRLMAEGLSRHDAVHAIGYVLAGHLHELLKQEGEVKSDPNEEYFRRLRGLTAAEWLQLADEDEADG